MKVRLFWRTYGVHRCVGETVLPGSFDDYAKPGGELDEWKIDEDKLIAALPPRFLPVVPSMVLLTVDDKIGGSGQRGLTRFRSWAKYFNCYSIGLEREADPAREQAEALISAYEKRPGFSDPLPPRRPRARLPDGIKRNRDGKFVSSKRPRSSHRYDSDS